MRRYILTTLLVLLAVMAGFAQTDALVVELNNGLADIYQVSANLRIVNQTDKDSIAVVDGDKPLASYAHADLKRITFDEEAMLADSIERAALIALYNATDGDHWKNNTNWCSDKPLREWYGVTVPKGRVTKLHLYQNQLTGSIPSELGNLTNLTSIDFPRNQLTGEIPKELGKLTNLTSIDFPYNQLAGEIPKELGNLINLTTLNFSRNQLAGEIPKELGNLINLTTLNFSQNQLTGEIPKELVKLTNLTNLALSYNKLIGEIPSSLGNLKNLEHLGLSGNQLTGEIPSTIGNLTNLQSLSLSNNQLTGEIPSTIDNLTNLQSLYLSFNQLTGEIPSTIGNLMNLRQLRLSNNQLTGEIPSSLGNLKNLEHLDLSGNQLTGEIPSTIGSLANLEHLDLCGNHLTGEIPSTVGSLANLEHLDLSFNQLTGEIPSTIGNLMNLRQLRLSYNQLTGEIPESINNLTNLITKLDENKGYFWGVYSSNNNLSGKIPSLLCTHPEWYYGWVSIMSGNRLFNLDEVKIPAPLFRVKDIDGNILDSKEIYPQHKYTVIFDWATWCGFSNALMPVVIDLYNKYKDYGLEVVGLTYGESEETIRNYVSKKNIQWSNFISTSDNKFENFLGGYPEGGTPHISIVDNNGRVIFTDNINERYSVSDFIKSRLGEGKPDVLYESTDFSADGKVTTLQTASSSGKDIKVVIMGDGFSDRQITDGSYAAAMQKAKDALFTTEPFKSYKNLFTVKSVTAVSKNDVFTESAQTAFSGRFGEGTFIEGNNVKVFEYAQKAIGAEDMDDAIIIVIMNSFKWAGTCWMYQPEKTNAWGSGATIAYVPNFDGTGGMFDYVSFETLLAHEAVGHGFAKLADEYVEHEQAIPANELENYKAQSQFGWWKNIDFTSNTQEVKWSDFISDGRYVNENIGTYEGGATYRSGVWRPTEKSIMSSDDTEFNAPSREAIWYRINKLTQGESWEGTREDFVAFDKARASARASARAKANNKDLPKPIRLAPPVVKKITWRMEK